MRKLLLLRLLLLFCGWMGVAGVLHAQTREVTGTVTDTAGTPIPFATIQVKGTKTTAVADANGKFAIKVAPGEVLVVTSTGMARQELRVGQALRMDARLVPQTQNLSEVTVTTALGIRRQARELGYATTSIKTAELNQAAVVNTATGLAAKVSGVDIRLADNGVDPQVKVTFRGSRSIEGSNSALIVIDGIPVDQTYLANLNPSDIEDVTILKGSNAAALYGMAASNGVMAITTRKGRGKLSLTYQNTVSFESISYFPSLQNEYSGWGGEPPGTWPNPSTGGTIQFINPWTGLVQTVPFENESFGEAYNSKDFHLDSIPIGENANQTWRFIPYRSVPNGRKDFFQTGVGDQNKLSGSFGNAKIGGVYFSGEHTSKQGVVPYDTYSRDGGRINGNLHAGRFELSGGVSYNSVQTDIAGNSYFQNRPVYWNVMNMLPSVDLKSIKNINDFAYNQGFVDAYFPNPWVQVFDARSKKKTDQLISNLSVSYKVNPWLTLTARGGYSRTTIDAPAFIDSINFPSWLSASGGPWGFSNLAVFPGNVGYQKEDITSHYDDGNVDGFLTAVRKTDHFKFTLIAGGNWRRRSSYGDWNSNQVNSGPVVGQNLIPSFYTKTTHGDGSADAIFSYKRYDQSVYGDLSIGYDSWLFLHGSFRNDWTSILSPGNRSFSYPSVDMSAVLSDKLAFLHNSNTVSFLKVRVGYAGTGNVSLEGYNELGVMGNIAGGKNLGGYSVALPNFGAYSIYPITTVGSGFPYGALRGFSQSTAAVQNGLQPEKTESFEGGFQLGLFANRVNLEVNYYDQKAKNQTIPLQTSNAAGINSYLTNAGEIDNNGVEIDLNLTPLFRIGDFRANISANFAYQNSKVVSIAGGQAELDQINFGTVVLGGVFAVPGKDYAQLRLTDFKRDPTGHVIVDGTTGLPSFSPDLIDAGNTNYKYFVGISPTLQYKGFSLHAVFDYRGGAKILNEEGNAMDFAGISSFDAQNRQAFIYPNSVIQTSPGKYTPNTNVPITSGFPGLPNSIFWWANYLNQIGTPYTVSAAFIKLRELSLTYDFPKKWLGTQQVIRGLQLSAIGRNLFMWRPKTNIWSDPEFSTNGAGNAVGYTTEFQTPPTRIISFSLTANIF
ncbi:SusC/RagA family TonB-linked outer membrane protein [Puia dinghuensis]|uniref:SusC/RagA family TonB-linked outer membrane protein n=1 Tax=Puia dinghuensis TaxID=1792502 RepID=A0A8J2XW09_9BACT|nr:SusC/RagA family TonB-linked outer membrane protein [Puia dinghuensis]GGB15849.1 SusC/RagA family TonB-linked outer membrane protein [Puia dinghuensis]